MNLFKRFLKVFLLILITVIVLAILNNRIYYFEYSNIKVDAVNLSKEDLARVAKIYSFIQDNEVLQGFKEINPDLIIYNEKYEFLFTNQEENEEWTYVVDDDQTSKHIYRREAKNSQAFATKVGNVDECLEEAVL